MGTVRPEPVILGGEFAFYEPISYFAKEDAQYGTEDNLDPIQGSNPTPPPPLEHYYGNLLKRIWEAASPSPAALAAGRSEFVLAGTRAPQGPVPAPRPRLTNPIAFPGAAAYLQGVATDWKKLEEIQRISDVFTFRGDSRTPHEIRKQYDGFQPPCTRTDDAYIKGAVYTQFAGYMKRRFQTDITPQVSDNEFLSLVRQEIPATAHRDLWIEYTIWRALCESEQGHIGRMVAAEALKGFTSTSKAVAVAKRFACANKTKRGTVYVIRVDHGFVVPEKAKHEWTHLFGEAEIAVFGTVPWSRVYGYRAVFDRLFVPNDHVAIRYELTHTDPEVFQQVYELLSGKAQ